MLRSLVKAMAVLGTTVATSVIYAVSFVMAGVMGTLVFGEQSNALWLCGGVFIVTGVYLVTPQQT